MFNGRSINQDTNEDPNDVYEAVASQEEFYLEEQEEEIRAESTFDEPPPQGSSTVVVESCVERKLEWEQEFTVKGDDDVDN